MSFELIRRFPATMSEKPAIVLAEKEQLPFKPGILEILKEAPTAMRAVLEIEAWHETTYRHTVSMINIADRLADHLNLPESEKKTLLCACAVHDWGKIFVSPEILGKSGRLDPKEQEEMRSHVMAGARLLKAEGELDLADISILHHTFKKEPYPGSDEIEKILPGHKKRMDGKKKELAELLAVLDMDEALLAVDRPYKDPMTKNKCKALMIAEFPGKEDIIGWLVDHSRGQAEETI